MAFVIHNVVYNVHNAKLWTFVIHNCLKRSQFCIMNDIVNNTKGQNIVNDIMNNKGHSIVNDNQLCS